MKDYKKLYDKAKELIELYRESNVLNIHPESSAIDWKRASDLREMIERLESELHQLEAEIEKEEKPIKLDNYTGPNYDPTDVACDICGCHPSVIIRTEYGRFCKEHAKYIKS
jgi:hypothetical protein